MKNLNLIIYACDFKQNGICGPETLARIEHGVKILKREKYKYRTISVFFGAGIIPNNKKYVAKEIMLQKFKLCLTLSIFEKVFLFSSAENAWGTFKETESIIYDSNFDKTADVIVISSSYHLPRIKFIFKFMPKMMVYFVSVPYTQSKLNQILEPLRYLKVLILGLFLKCFLLKSVVCF